MEPLSEPVWLDRDMWEKIVLNLLSNAYKFTLEGGIRLRLTEEEGKAVLEVTDSGVGVPEDSLPRLFDRFYRIEHSGGRTHEGSGIGLALVQELVRLHGGTIEVASRIGAVGADAVVSTLPRLPGPRRVPQTGSSVTISETRARRPHDHLCGGLGRSDIMRGDRLDEARVGLIRVTVC